MKKKIKTWIETYFILNYLEILMNIINEIFFVN